MEQLSRWRLENLVRAGQEKAEKRRGKLHPGSKPGADVMEESRTQHTWGGGHISQGGSHEPLELPQPWSVSIKAHFGGQSEGREKNWPAVDNCSSFF